MELKFLREQIKKVSEQGSNRTFMELKLAPQGSCGCFFRRSNRTFMELK